MIAPARERGTALLTMLLLVAVMATVAATALDRLGIGTRLAANAGAISQAHAWLTTAELLAITRLEDRLAADDAQTTLAGGWLGVDRTIGLPGGGTVKARLDDGNNCFNLNSLVERAGNGQLIARPSAARQFVALMVSLGIGEGEAVQIASSATDYIDADSSPLPSGAEDSAQQSGGLSANQLMADESELRAVPNVTEGHYSLLRRWICALPDAELSALNVNTLLPEQAPLLAMLVPGRLEVARARAVISARPGGGFGSVVKFWASPILAGTKPDESAAGQVKVRTSFFNLRIGVDVADALVSEVAMVDARTSPARILRRQLGEIG